MSHLPRALLAVTRRLQTLLDRRDPVAATPQIAGEAVAAVLQRTAGHLARPGRLTAVAWATDAAGTPITIAAELEHAKTLSVLAAIELASDNLDLQQAACTALRETLEAAGIKRSLRRLGSRESHADVLALINDAARHARSRRWPAREPLQLPDGPPTRRQWDRLGHEHQDAGAFYFGGEQYAGGQHDSTRALVLATLADHERLGAYAERHHDTIVTMVRRREHRPSARIASAARAIRTRNRRGDEEAF